jgi:PEP-CTERM motif-containing protein
MRIVSKSCCWIGLAGCLLASPAMGTVIFNDTFGSGSTIPTGAYPAPTSSSAGYAIASNQNASTSSIASGNLEVTSAKSSNAITEVQAIFTHTPVSLNVGDKIDLIMSFTDTGGVMVSGSSTSAAIYFGLYNSEASPGYSSTQAPENNLNNVGLSSSDTNDATGGVAGYKGYVSETFFTGNGNGGRIDTRPVQSNGTNVDQDLVSDATSSSASYTGGTTVGSKSAASALTLVAGDKYTEDLSITLTAAGVETLTGSLYSGTGTGGTQLNTYSGSTATNNNFETSSFDALAAGYRNTDDVVSSLDFSQIEVLYTPAVPEPGSLMLLGAVGLVGFWRRRAVRKI